jgi:uncharacterized protein (TIGR02246 family)
LAETDWIREMVAAWSANDGEKAASFFAPDGSYEDVGAGRLWEGREAVAHMIAVLLGGFSPGSTFDVVSAVCDASGYAFQWRWKGTHQKTGRAFDMRGASIGELRDGLILHHFDYYDLAHLTDQLAPSE